jgi:hypothetical protein
VVPTESSAQNPLVCPALSQFSGATSGGDRRNSESVPNATLLGAGRVPPHYSTYKAGYR